MKLFVCYVNNGSGDGDGDGDVDGTDALHIFALLNFNCLLFVGKRKNLNEMYIEKKCLYTHLFVWHTQNAKSTIAMQIIRKNKSEMNALYEKHKRQ